MPTPTTPDKPTSQQSEMDKLRQELLNDPKVRIGKNVLRDLERDRMAKPTAV
jgi:hypothetical protein